MRVPMHVRILMSEDEVGVRCPEGTVRPDDEELRVVTADADETDINRIVKRFQAVGVSPLDIKGRPALYLDARELATYQNLWDRVNMVNDYFASLPAETRGHFENDPRKLIAAMVDDERREELVKYGIWPEEQQEDLTKVPAPAPGEVKPA